MNDCIVIRPIEKSDDSFAVEILKDLVSQGYSGEELIERFTEEKQNIKKAIGLLINEADEIATGKRKGSTSEDIFG